MKDEKLRNAWCEYGAGGAGAMRKSPEMSHQAFSNISHIPPPSPFSSRLSRINSYSWQGYVT